jgi:rhamnogalacturonyl hydrolase YesR
MIGHWQKLADTIVVRHFGDSLKVVPGINYKEWAWCDALFMGPPAMAYLSTALNDERYLRKADSLWWKTTEYLYDSTAHLFYRDSRFFDKREANGEKVFWSRGNGWVLAALVRMIQNMPEGFPSRRRYINLFIEMSEKVLSLQQSDGSWHASLLNPAAYKDRETSGTALFCYALAWGVRRDLLPKEEYLPAIARAWGALESAVHPDGKLGFVQKAGDKPWLSGYNDTSPFGAGAFLLAGSEVYRLSAGW